MIELTVPTPLQEKMDRIAEDATECGYVGVYETMVKAIGLGVDFEAVDNYDDVCVATYRKMTGDTGTAVTFITTGTPVMQ